MKVRDLPDDDFQKKPDATHRWMNFSKDGVVWGTGAGILELSSDVNMLHLLNSGLMDKKGNVKGDVFDAKKIKEEWKRFNKKSISYRRQIYSLAGLTHLGP